MTTFEPVTDSQCLLASFGVTLPEEEDAAAAPASTPPSTPSPLQPFIVRAEIQRQESLGHIRQGTPGLLAPTGPRSGGARHTSDCRVETMKSNPACRKSWWAGRRCVIPAASLSPWCYESGRAQRWSITRADGAPLALAGLWSERVDSAGERASSFCLLTVNADGHEVFGRMDAPDHEKRMPAILDAGALTLWLYGSLKDAERLLRPCPASQLRQSLQPSPSKVRREPRSWETIPDMFAYEWHMTAAQLPRVRKSRVSRPALAPSQDMTPTSVESQQPMSGSLF